MMMATQVQKTLLIDNLRILAEKCSQNIGAPGVNDEESGYYESAASHIWVYIQAIDKIAPGDLNSGQANLARILTLAAIDELNNGIDYNDIAALNLLFKQLDTLLV
ncbi:hypothetical protein [Yokenella regensburgei]|jgi:hypothetical protein|uniref:hypothetical protein n=2 Tax=Yokenella regensburgei TaxID=158877 RepID=UPI001432C712|nr:hypothetical protein [Yokenella regensburgei]QIU91855.1 hypothetical protein HEC60_22315 [Yokenella regensburgei]